MEYKVLIFWSCLALVVVVAFGWTVFSKLRVLNNRHHIITWDDENVYVYEENDDEEDKSGRNE